MLQEITCSSLAESITSNAELIYAEDAKVGQTVHVLRSTSDNGAGFYICNNAFPQRLVSNYGGNMVEYEGEATLLGFDEDFKCRVLIESDVNLG